MEENEKLSKLREALKSVVSFDAGDVIRNATIYDVELATAWAQV